MPSLMFKQQSYGGTSTVDDASHVIADNGSGVDVTSQQLFENILGDLATVESSSTASKGYSVGDYLILNSCLYRVTEIIGYGDTIIPNTNVVQTTVCETFTGVNSNIQSIFKDFATVELSTTASKAYAVGDYLIYDGNLYVVIEKIAKDAQIKTGLEPGAVFVNVTRTTVGKEIPRFRQKQYFKSYTVSANASASITVNVSKLGYTPIAVRSFRSNSPNVLTYNIQIDDDAQTVEVGLRNVSSSNVTDTYNVDVLYATEVLDFVEPILLHGD